ncbi:MAG: hypothetical protein R3F62_27435 [Planctomycetota bacterium]
MAELILVRIPPVRWPRRLTILLILALGAFSANQFLTLGRAPILPPGHEDELVRRVFFPLTPERPLYLGVSDIQERLTVGMILRYGPLDAAETADVTLRFDWLDTRGNVVAARRWSKPMRLAPQSHDAISLFLDPAGHRLSSHRNVVLPREPFPPRAVNLRVGLEQEVPGELLVRFFTRQPISVGLRAQAVQNERLDKFASRSSVPPELLPTAVRDQVQGYTWATLKAVDEQGEPAPARALLRRELTLEEREAFFASLSRELADPTWHALQAHRPLAFDVTEPGRFALEFDRLVSPEDEARIGLTLRVPGEPLEALPLHLLQQAAPLFLPAPSTLVVTYDGGALSARLRAQDRPRTPLVPPATDRRLAYLTGDPPALQRLLVPLIRDLPPDTALEPPPGRLVYRFTPEEVAQQVAMRLRVRRVGPAEDPGLALAPPLLVHWRLEGDTSAQGFGGETEVTLEPRELERLPDEFQHLATSGGGILSVRLPLWVRSVEAWTDDPALIYADLSLPDVRLPEPVPAEHTPRYLCALGSDPRGRRFFRVRPDNGPEHQLAATDLLLSIQNGLVRGPRDPRPDPSRQVLNLTTGAEAQPFLVPLRPRGTYPQEDGVEPLREDAYRVLGEGEAVDVFAEGQPFPEPREVIVLPARGPAERHLLARGRPPVPAGASALVSDPNSPAAAWVLRHALPATDQEPFTATWEHDGQPGYVVVDVLKPEAEALQLDLDVTPSRRPILSGLPVTVLPTDTQRSFLLEAGSEPRALAFEPGIAPRGAAWRLVVGFGADLPIGEVALRVRPREGHVWVVARVVRPSRMVRGETWSADVQDVAAVEVIRHGATPEDPLEQVSLSGAYAPLSSPLAPTAVGVSTTNVSGSLFGVRILGELEDGRKVLLPRSEVLVRAHPLPLVVPRPPGDWPGLGVARVILLWSSADAQAPPEDELELRLVRAVGVEAWREPPSWRRLERAGRVEHPGHLVWRSRPLYLPLPNDVARLELQGPPGVQALVAVRVVEPDGVVIHGGGLPAGTLGRVIEVSAPARFGGQSEVLTRPPGDLQWLGDEPDAEGFTTLTRSYRKEGEWRLLEPLRDDASEFRMTPRELSERQDPVLRFEANAAEVQPLAVFGASTRVTLSGPAPIRAAAPFQVLRPVAPGEPLPVDLAEPNPSPEAFPHVLLRYAGIPVAFEDPVELTVLLDGVELRTERVVTPDGRLTIGDVSPSAHTLEVRASRPLGAGQLWVRTLDHPRPGDLRTTSAWALDDPEPLTVSLPVDLEPGDVWVLEVFGEERPGLQWSDWTLELYGREGELLRREQHHVFGTTADDAPLRGPDGAPAWPLIRLGRRCTFEDVHARTAILRGPRPARVGVRALCVRRSAQ